MINFTDDEINTLIEAMNEYKMNYTNRIVQLNYMNSIIAKLENIIHTREDNGDSSSNTNFDSRQNNTYREVSSKVYSDFIKAINQLKSDK